MTKDERETADRAKVWQKATLDAAYEHVRLVLWREHYEVRDQGGLVVTIADPDGHPVDYFVRLTEVPK